eukprot:7350950-Prymnesium_polylepis.2
MPNLCRRTVYAIGALPFLVFALPVVGHALHGAQPTGYDRHGLLVPKMTVVELKRKVQEDIKLAKEADHLCQKKERFLKQKIATKRASSEPSANGESGANDEHAIEDAANQDAAVYIQKMVRGHQRRRSALAHIMWWSSFWVPGQAHISMAGAENRADFLMGRIGGPGALQRNILRRKSGGARGGKRDKGDKDEADSCEVQGAFDV